MRKLLIFTTAAFFMLVGLVFSSFSAQAEGQYQDGAIEHGKYIATLAGCTSCHTPYKAEYQKPPQELTLEQIQTLAFNDKDATDQDKLFAGGRAFDLGPAGILLTRNLTPDKETGIGNWTDDQIKLAVKTGVDNHGKVLFPVMPYHVFNTMADADLEAVIAYLHSVNAISNQVPDRTISTEGFPTPPYQTGITAPNASDKAARGSYLVNSVMGCTDCHTPVDPQTGAPILEKYLAGGQPYEGPWGIVYGGNITPDKDTGIGTWSQEEIKRALLTGVGKTGRRLILMPWYVYSSLTAEDADAVAYYLKNGLTAVNNQVPATSVKDNFVVMAPQAANQSSAGIGAVSPILLVAIAVAIILLVSAISYFTRRKSA